MKRLLILFIFLFSLIALAQVTSKFTRYFIRQDGTAITGATIELVPQRNTYPNGALECTENPLRPGYYVRGEVPDGEYQIYVNGNLYDQNIWLGANRLSMIAQSYITPEEYGATGDGIADDTYYLRDAMEAGKGREVILRGIYKVTSRLDIDLENERTTITGSKDSRIVSAITPYDDPDYYHDSVGVIQFRNASDLIINGLEIESNNSGSVTQNDNGLSIVNCLYVDMRNTRTRYAGYNGVYARGIEMFSATDCISDSNLYGGLLLREVYQVNINGGSYSYNGSYGTVTGIDHYLAGYGIALGTKWYGIAHFAGAYEETEGILNVTITGVKLWYNNRSALSGHGGSSTIIKGNHFKGWTAQGYAPLNYTGEDGGESWDRNIIITSNVFENDSLWIHGKIFQGYTDRGEYASGTTYYANEAVYYGFTTYRALRTTVGDQPDISPSDWEVCVTTVYTKNVSIGEYQPDEEYEAGGFIVSNNIFYKCNAPKSHSIIEGVLWRADPDYDVAPYLNATNDWRGHVSAMTITGNQIIDSYGAIYGAIYIGGDEGAVDNPDVLTISDNIIIGRGENALAVLCGNGINITNNQIFGIWNNPLTVTVPHRRWGNKYNGQDLSDMVAQRSYIDYFRRDGRIDFSINTSADSLTIRFGTIDMDWTRDYDRAGVVAKVNFSSVYYYPTAFENWEGMSAIGFSGEPVHTNWNSYTTYSEGQYVRSGNDYYLCILANSNHEPPNATYWQLYEADEVAYYDTCRTVFSGGFWYSPNDPPDLPKPLIFWNNEGGNKRSLCMTFKSTYTNYIGSIQFTGGNYIILQDTISADTLNDSSSPETASYLSFSQWRNHKWDDRNRIEAIYDSLLAFRDSINRFGDTLRVHNTRLLALSDSIKTHRDSISALRDRKVDSYYSSIDNALARFDGTTGKQIQSSSTTTLSDAGNLQITGTGNLETRFQGTSNSATSKLFVSHSSAGDGGLYYNSSLNTLDVFSYDDITFRTGAITGGLGTSRLLINADNGAVEVGAFRLGTSTTAGYVMKADANGYAYWDAQSGMIYPGAGIALSTGSAWGTSITDNSANWNTAYGWGNHAGMGYAVANNGTHTGITNIAYLNLTDTYNQINTSINDMYFRAGNGTTGKDFMFGYGTGYGDDFIFYGGTTSNKFTVDQDGAGTFASTVTWNGGSSTNANTAYGWGNHASAGYLTSQTSHADVVVDGDFSAGNGILIKTGVGAYDVITNNASNWNTAYGWGNHASAGYLTGNQSITLSGDVSGSGTTSISATVANDSHDHTASTISGLSTSDFTSANLSNWTNDMTSDYYPSIAVSGSGTNSVTFTITIKKMNDGAVSSSYYMTNFWVASADNAMPGTGGDYTASVEVGTGIELETEGITKVNKGMTNSSGVMTIVVSCTNGSYDSNYILFIEVQGRVYYQSFALQDMV